MMAVRRLKFQRIVRYYVLANGDVYATVLFDDGLRTNVEGGVLSHFEKMKPNQEVHFDDEYDAVYRP